jgi:transcriptional regulator with XRE-family HTH domain
MVSETLPTLNERERVGLALRAARKAAQISTALGAERADISVPTLGSIERGSHSLTSLSSGNLAKLHKAFGLTWGEFLAIIVPVYGDYLPYLKSQFNAGINKPVDFNPTTIRSRHLQMAGIVGAGLNPHAQPFDHMETISIPDFAAIEDYDDDVLMVLKVSGDSMTCEEARLAVPEGSLAVFHKTMAPQPGDVVAVWLGEEGVGVLKVWRPQPEAHVILESYNKRHLPIVISEDHPGEVQGVYIGHISSGRRAHNRKPPVTTH